MLVNSNSGEIVTPVAGFWEIEEVDATKFIKLFINGVRALADLSSPGTKVFEILYLAMQQNIGKDQVYLSYSSIDISKKISRATFKRGLAELIDKKFLAAKPDVGWFWINPDYIWNGDRLAFIKEYRRESIKKIKEDMKKMEE